MLCVIVGTQLAIASTNTNVIHAKVDIWPRVLCIRRGYCEGDSMSNIESFGECESLCEWDCSHGRWITAFIRLHGKYNVRNIDPSTVTLQVMDSNIPVSEYRIFWRKIFVAKFDRDAVIDVLCPMLEHMAPHAKTKVTFVVTGNLFDGKSFRGEDTIRVILWD
jgi:hypothetical protein